MAESFSTARLDELPAVRVLDGALTWRPVRRHFGIESFGANVYTAEKQGEQVVEDHFERDGPEELYVVLRGRAAFTLGEDALDAPVGTLVFVRPGTRRAAVATEPGTAVLAIGAKSGEVFSPSGWEWGALAFAELRAGNEEEARRILLEGVDREPDHWAGPYNLACFEARAGRLDEALAALGRAVELDPEHARKYAAGDTDLAPLRGDPRFESLIG
jgi:tetratricopeptide (TPR) repeat protein